jgi:GT2 family glycosyltransferase
MSARVSIVIPTLDDFELLEAHLPLLLEEVEARGADDEVTLVDDTGADLLAAWVAERFPGRVRVMVRGENGGFGRALLTGARVGTADYLLALNPDVRVRRGFLQPLVDALDAPEVFAVSPRVLLGGDPRRVETHQRMAVAEGRLRSVPLAPNPDDLAPRPIPFPLGGAMLLRRDAFVVAGGFDSLFEPFYFEDTDLGLSAWRQGLRILEVPASVVEHHHRGTIGPRVPEELVRAAIERNRLLLHWKHLDSRPAALEHLRSLHRDAFDAAMGDRREELVWLALALESLEPASASRRSVTPVERTLAESLEASDPSR